MRLNQEKYNIPVIILAAGASRRMGTPKQLLSYGQKSLINHVIECAQRSEAQNIIVVLGAYANQIESTINQGIVLKNEQWNQGISSSIRCGINYINSYLPSTDAVVILLCDQPLVTSSLINQLLYTYSQNKYQIIACQYGKTRGVPALFPAHFFPQLVKLRGDKGAKKIIEEYSEQVLTISFPPGALDLDYPHDYERLHRSVKNLPL